jgi:hypothetical protein
MPITGPSPYRPFAVPDGGLPAGQASIGSEVGG